MTSLAEKKCVPCEGGTPALTADESQALLERVPGWTLSQPEGQSPRIEKSYKFDGFMPGVAFVNEVARVAEEQGHHPDILLRWGEVRVTLWTHAVKGLTENDFILAAKTEKLKK